MSEASDLERILLLAADARRLRDSPRWKTDPEVAVGDYGNACDALWEELFRQLDARAANGNPAKMPPAAPDPRKDIERRVLAALRSDLPDMVRSIIDAA